ncbi:MAG: cell division protein FtsA [Lentisphaerae bacterium]|nr:cell division protein FtsA [Lentisphaerota bacterium]
MAVTPIVALEIGTSQITAIVGEEREGDHVMVTGIGKCPSAGVRKGEIIDLENAVVGVRDALAAAEESSGVAIRQIHLAISGGHIRSTRNRGTVPVLGREGEITDDDVEQVMEVARALNLGPERQVLHTICQHFWIDDEERVVRPEGMEGAKLSLDMLVLHGVRNRLRNAAKVVRTVPMDIHDVVFSGLCSALSVLTPEQKTGGAIVIDIGGGTTEYVAYAGGVHAAAGAIGVGGDHITNDIAVAFSIPISQAERLKKDAGAAVVKSDSSAQRLSLPAEVGFQGRTVSLKSLHTVIGARMEELFSMICRELDADDVRRQAGAGIVLTGGGAHMRGALELAEKVFGLPAMIGKPRNVNGLATATEGPEYATCVGLLEYAFKTASSQRSRGFLGLLQRVLGRSE